MVVHRFEVPGFLLCSGHSRVLCRFSRGAGATGLGFLSCQWISYLLGQINKLCEMDCGRAQDYMVGNKRCISIATREEAEC